MKSFKCKECGVEFEERRSLHCHIKAHKMKVGEYYYKHFPRVDLYTHKPIAFKNVDQYLTSDFNRADNLSKWIKREPELITKPYLVNLIKEKIKGRSKTVFGQTQLESYKLPSVLEIENLFGSYKEFCDQVGLPSQFPDEMPSEYNDDHSGLTILVDSREQAPLNFKYTETFSLDFGDYSLNARNFDYTFVERKSINDFVSSVSLDFDRVDREIERCKSAGCYLFFVIEGSISRVEKYMGFNRWKQKSTHSHIMHSMRELLRKHEGWCQFVFTSGRKESLLIIPKLLYCGRRVWKVDVQKYLDNVAKR